MNESLFLRALRDHRAELAWYHSIKGYRVGSAGFRWILARIKDYAELTDD